MNEKISKTTAPATSPSAKETSGEPNRFAIEFARQLVAINHLREHKKKLTDGVEKLHVQTTGALVAALYENLRNASENAEESLLLLHAIRRFLKRRLLNPNYQTEHLGEDLITEMTLAGYLANNSIALTTIDAISTIATEFLTARHVLRQRFKKETADRWALDPLAAAIESELRDHTATAAYIDCAYQYFYAAIDPKPNFSQDPNYAATLFVAVSQILLKSDPAMIRLALIRRYQVSPLKAVDFAKLNAQIDAVFRDDTKTLNRLGRIINRHGAPFRIMLRALHENDNFAKNLDSEKDFLGPFNLAILDTYKLVAANVNRGVLRSVIFLIITKVLIGVAIEVPYDIWRHGAIAWLPLAVNLLIPPLYMVALRLTLAMPSPLNSQSLRREISRILFSHIPSKPFLKKRDQKFSVTYNIAYTLAILAVFSGVGWLLVHFAQFAWFHLFIFFFFISTASFLGFRLSRQIREIEVGTEIQSGVSMIRDVIYMPFVVVGRRISDTYSHINIVSHFLDIFVEMPLKSIIGFVRQWGNFLSAKKDDF
jgi:hypothetical protein